MSDDTGKPDHQQDQPADDLPPEANVDPVDESAELRDRLLRTLAEMENLRQRTRREVEEAQTYAVTRFARDLLEVADNLRRAVESAPGGEQADAVRNLVAGVEMTERSLLSAFERHKIRKVTPTRGERFDHKVHQAMFELPTNEVPPGTVAEVMAPGYVLADRLLRAAMVGVAKASAEPEPTGTEPRGSVIDTSA